MPTRPTELPHFATVPTTGYPGRVAPNAGQQDTGYQNGEAPPAAEHNYLFGIALDWIAYLVGEFDAIDPSVLDAALRSVANTFTAAQTVNFDDNETALISTTKTAEDAPGFPAADWKLLLDAKMVKDTSDHRKVRVYAGPNRSDTLGAFAITINAVYSTNTANWYPDNNGFGSLGVFFADGRIIVSAQNAGASPWATWPTDKGNLTLGGTATVGHLTSNGQLAVVSGGAAISGNTSVTGTAFADAFGYRVVASRSTPINLAHCYGPVCRNADGAVTRNGITAMGPDVAWQLRPPVGCHFSTITIRHWQGSDGPPAATADTFTLIKRTSLGGSWSTVKAVTAAATAGELTTTLGLDSAEIPADHDEYQLVWHVNSTDLAAAANYVIAMEFSGWNDYGPRNGTQ
jgi:hypothetical protein